MYVPYRGKVHIRLSALVFAAIGKVSCLKHKKKVQLKRKKKYGETDTFWEMEDEEVAVGIGISPEAEERVEPTREAEEEMTTCPECGGSLFLADESGGAMGVGKTHAQARMKPFSVSSEVVCSKCGLVVGKSVRHVHP